MLRAGNITSEEKAVCLRVRTLRNLAGESQQRLAQFTGLTRDQVANIETGRTILGFWAGWHLCRVFNVNQRYLATGVDPVNPFLQFNPLDLAVPIGESESFLSVYLSKINGEIAARMALYESAAELEDALPLYATDQSHKIKGSEIISVKDNLDSSSEPDIVRAMSAKEVPTWVQLKKTIAKLTAEHGQKTALARELGVSQQVLGNWLSDGGQGAPNAELTLRLFKWSLDPKRQQMK